MNDQEKLAWYEKKYGPIIEKRGMHNWKNLFKKPKLQDIIIFIMLVMVLFGAWAYQHDVEVCQNTIEHPDELCQAYCEIQLSNQTLNTNTQNIILNEQEKPK